MYCVSFRGMGEEMDCAELGNIIIDGKILSAIYPFLDKNESINFSIWRNT